MKLFGPFLVILLLFSLRSGGKGLFGRYSSMKNFNINHLMNNMFQKSFYYYDPRVNNDNNQQQERAPNGGMTLKEARAILGVNDKSTPIEIKKAYYELMKKVHPDYGGSQYLASQLNKAKEVLLQD